MNFIILVGLLMIIYEKYLFEECINENKNIVNFFESSIFATIIKNNGKLFIISGIINIFLKNTMFELYSFIILILVCLIFVISYIMGLVTYMKK